MDALHVLKLQGKVLYLVRIPDVRECWKCLIVLRYLGRIGHTRLDRGEGQRLCSSARQDAVCHLPGCLECS